MSDASQVSAGNEPEPRVIPVRVRDQLRGKIPEILLEAGSVLFAILLAFAVDQWREDREHREMAQRARNTILSELRANREELRGTFRDNEEKAVSLRAQIALLRQNKARSLETTMHLAQLSAAAFQAAQSTQAIQFIDFEWLVRVGRVYELQKTYALAQDAALNEMSLASGMLSSGEKPLPIMERVSSRLTTTQQIGKGLLNAYDKMLAQ